MQTVKLEGKKPRMIAHRGLSLLEKENTMAAFIAAGNRSYYGIECDIHPTADGVFVVCHDENLKRVSGVDINVEKSTYAQVQQVQLWDLESEVCRPHLRVPTLEEYIRCCKKYEKIAVVEFKNQFSFADVEKVLAIIGQIGYLEHCVFISFFVENLRYVRRLQPAAKVQLLLEAYDEAAIQTMLAEKMDLDIYYGALDREKVDFLHEHNVTVNVWTVNSKATAQALADMGVDQITTDILE